MNTRIHLIALSSLAFGLSAPAIAQEATVFPAVSVASEVSRADVRAEAIRALSAGELTEYAALVGPAPAASELSREDVRQATLKAIDNGTASRIDAEAQKLG